MILKFDPGVVRTPLTAEARAALLPSLHRWTIEARDQVDMLVAEFTLPDFVSALAFANGVGALAEQWNHHPELTITYGRVTVRWWTHTAAGVANNDAFMAMETNRLAALDSAD
jgi:4a-hydroxytetrahydrobiopterin dehydratase